MVINSNQMNDVYNREREGREKEEEKDFNSFVGQIIMVPCHMCRVMNPTLAHDLQAHCHPTTSNSSILNWRLGTQRPFFIVAIGLAINQLPSERIVSLAHGRRKAIHKNGITGLVVDCRSEQYMVYICRWSVHTNSRTFYSHFFHVPN